MLSNTAIPCSCAVEINDETLAARCSLPLLITAPCMGGLVKVARRVHAAALGAPAPLVTFRATGFFGRRVPFCAQWAGLLDMARGGSVLLTAVDEMAVEAQVLLAEALTKLRVARVPRAPRFMAGTTAPLYDMVLAGEFSEDLFYRLNAIHLVLREEECDVHAEA